MYPACTQRVIRSILSILEFVNNHFIVHIILLHNKTTSKHAFVSRICRCAESVTRRPTFVRHQIHPHSFPLMSSQDTEVNMRMFPWDERKVSTFGCLPICEAVWRQNVYKVREMCSSLSSFAVSGFLSLTF